MFRLLLLLLGLVFAHAFSAASALSLYFEPNRGQAPPDIRYVAHVRGAAISLSDAGISVASRDALTTLEFEGARTGAAWQPGEAGAGSTSYYIGRDPARWLRGVPHFQRVVRHGLYPDIDFAFYGAEGRLEYDLNVAPGADPSHIRLRFPGADRLHLTPAGDLAIETAHGLLVQKRPTVYQTMASGAIRRVDARYRLLPGRRAAFVLGGYDHRRALTIDPVLQSATLLGGSGDDTVALADPLAYIVGSTVSPDFPGLPVGPHRGIDVFLYSPASQSTIIFGGSGDDIVTCASESQSATSQITVLVGGYTNSQDFPTLVNIPYVNTPQAQYGGGAWDGFVVAFTGGGPSFATYLGGSGDDRVLAVDAGSGIWGNFSAAGSTTSTNFPVANAWQSTPGGGLDGFVTVFGGMGSGLQGVSPLLLSSYLGGSGDDRALAVAGASATDFYVAGQTASGDWSLPTAWNGARQGPSDGFLIHAHRDTAAQQFSPVAGSLWGGSADDRITQLKLLPNGNLAAAGVTGSPDFAAGSAALPGLQGPSDAFVAVSTPDLAAVPVAQLIGGTGDEEPLSLAVNRFNEILAGGWTSSTDFPVANPISAQYAGGASDGFLFHLDSAGHVMWSSYYGGSGADRITSVLFEDGPRIFVGGATNSPDLPLVQPAQPNPAGGLDGFYGSVILPVIHADGLTGGKDLAAAGYARLGDPSNSTGVPLTVTSADPSNVIVAVNADDPGQSAITLSARAASTELIGRAFLVYCLTDSGSYSLTLTAPGYDPRTIPVRCVPGVLSVTPQITVAANVNGAGSGSVAIGTAALDPVTGRALPQNPRGGLVPVDVSVAAPDASVLTFRNASATLDQWNGSASLGFTTSAIGSTILTLTTSSGFPCAPSSQVPVRVTGPAMSLYIPVLARDFVDYLGVGLNPPPSAPIAVTLTTSDPTRVRLTATPTASGSASATINCGYTGCSAIYLETLDTSSPVTITATGPGLDPVTVPVRFGVPTAHFLDQYYRPISSPAQWGTGNVTVNLAVSTSFDPITFSPYSSVPTLRAGAAPVSVQLTSSNPGALAVTSGGWALRPGAASWIGAIGLTAGASGSSVLSAQFTPSGFATVQPVTVNAGGAWSIGSATVGGNLQAAVPLTVPGSTKPVAVTVTSGDPSRVLLSSDLTQPGTASLKLSVQYGAQVYVQALADSGDVPVTASLAGSPDVTATIHLVPAGIAWTTAGLTATTADTPSASLLGYALDPANLAPLAAQIFRPGLGAATLQVSNSGVAIPPASSVPLVPQGQSYGPNPISVNLTPQAPGATDISILPPPGFATPAGRPPLHVTITLPAFTLGPASVGRGMQSRLAISFPANATPPSAALPPLILTSGDATRLLLATNPNAPGSASVTLARTADPNAGPLALYQPVYLQAIDGPADVPITATLAGYRDAATIVQIVPTSLQFATYSSLTTNTQSSPSSVTIYAVGQDGSVTGGDEMRLLWAGFPSTSVNIRSSNPAVAAARAAPQLNALTNSATFQVTPLAAGATDLSIDDPPGFVSPTPSQGRTLHVTVQGSSFTLAPMTIGRDLQISLPLNMQNGPGVPAQDVDVQLTSDNPGLLLSASTTSAGSQSLTVHLRAGQQATSVAVYLQALTDTGTATVALTAPGYSPGSATFTFAPTTFATNAYSPFTLAPQTFTTVALRPVPAGANQGGGFQFRPGLAPFTIGINAADPTIATVTPAQATVAAGTSEIDFKVQAVGAGSTTIAFAVPAPYVAPAALPVTIQGGQLSLYGPSSLGKDLQAAFNLSNSTGVTVASSDPSRVLVSASPQTAGQGSLSGLKGTVYVQSLADSGSVTLTASAPGYQSASVTVALAPAEVVLLATNYTPPLTTLSTPLSLQAQPTAATVNSGAQSRRPGAAPVTVPVTLSDATVGVLSASQVTFNPGDSTAAFTFQPRAAGSELISLGVPAGFADPLGARELLVNVVAPHLSVSGPLAVGKDLEASATATLSAAPAQSVTVTLASADPASLELAGPQGVPAASIGLGFYSYSPSSVSFYLDGMAASGSVLINASAPGLSPVSYTATLQPSGFRFANLSAALAAGKSTTVQIVSSMLAPGALTPAGDLPVRRNLPAPLPLTVTSSDPSVVTVVSPVYFYAGDRQESLTITGVGPGAATLTITTPPGWSTSAGGNKIAVIVQ